MTIHDIHLPIYRSNHPHSWLYIEKVPVILRFQWKRSVLLPFAVSVLLARLKWVGILGIRNIYIHVCMYIESCAYLLILWSLYVDMSHDCISPCVRTGTCVVCGHRSDVGDDWCLAFSSSTRTRTCSACQRVNECTQSYMNVCRFFYTRQLCWLWGRWFGRWVFVVRLCSVSWVQFSRVHCSLQPIVCMCCAPCSVLCVTWLVDCCSHFIVCLPSVV